MIEFKRKIYNKLVRWKESSNGSSALLIEGARRIGKSHIATLFAQNEYDSYILIDFSKAPKMVKSWFDDYLEDVDILLEGAVATAEKLKSGNPYSTFIVVTETYAVAEEVDPIYSRIDQIFVLRKCKHDKNNRLPQPIAPDVLKKLVDLVERRLTGAWSNVSERMMNDGAII